MPQLSTRHAWAMMTRLAARCWWNPRHPRHRVVRLYAEQKVGSRGDPSPVGFPGVTVLATTVGLRRRCRRGQRSSGGSRLTQDEARIYAKDLSVEAQGPCAIKEAYRHEED
jgi:hypothetical protein